MLHASVQTPLNADFSAFCPVAGLQHLLAVGTYQLNESSQSRAGRLHIYDTSRIGSSDMHGLTELEAHEQPGIFGMEWLQCSNQGSRPSLALALADGHLQIMSLVESTSLERSCSILIEPDGMVLSVDRQRHGSAGDVLVATTASCQAALVQVHGLCCSMLAMPYACSCSWYHVDVESPPLLAEAA